MPPENYRPFDRGGRTASTQRLHLGSWTCVSNLLTEPPQTQPQAQAELRLC